MLFIAPTIIADEKQDFQSAYKAYQQYMKENDTLKATKAAEQAYQLGEKVYGKRSMNVANLAINYAMLLNDARKSKEAKKVLKGKLRSLEKEHGRSSSKLVPLLFELGRTDFDLKGPRDGLRYFNRSAALLEQHEDALYRGKINFDIVSFLLKRRANTHTRKFVEAAHAAYTDALTPEDIRLGLASYHMALWSIADQRYADAGDYLNTSLNAFDAGDDSMGSLERTVRVMLVNVLESLGDSDLATPHLLALGKSQNWVTPVRPLYIQDPNLENSDELFGDVRLAFAVDLEGFVRHASVESSSEDRLNQTALGIISKARFAPQFVDGEPVSTDDVSYTLYFGSEEVATVYEDDTIVEIPRPPLRDFPTPSVYEAERDEVLHPGLDAEKEREDSGNVYF